MNGRRFRTSLLMQLREYRARVLPLVMVALIPMGWWAANFFSVPADAEPVPPQELESFAAGIGPLVWTDPPEGDIWAMLSLLTGVAWAMGAAALFSVIGSGSRDRRLVLAGFRSREIMLARFLILLSIAIPVSLIPVVVIAGLSTLPSPQHQPGLAGVILHGGCRGSDRPNRRLPASPANWRALSCSSRSSASSSAFPLASRCGTTFRCTGLRRSF